MALPSAEPAIFAHMDVDKSNINPLVPLKASFPTLLPPPTPPPPPPSPPYPSLNWFEYTNRAL